MTGEMNPKEKTNAATLIRPLTKSRFRKANECATKLFYVNKDAYADTSRGDSFLKALAEGGFQVGELAKLYYPGGREIVPSAYADALTQTNLLLTQKEITIYEGAFTYKNLFIRADIVTRAGDKLFLREVKAKSWSETASFWTKKEPRIRADYLEYLEDIAFQYYVVKRAYPKLKVIPSLVMADRDATASVDGINQHFVLIKEGERARATRDAVEPRRGGAGDPSARRQKRPRRGDVATRSAGLRGAHSHLRQSVPGRREDRVGALSCLQGMRVSRRTR